MRKSLHRAKLGQPNKLPSDRRQRHSAEIREKLFRAALKLFGEKGLAETTVEDITNAADVGKGTFFNYFPSKEHILIAFGEMQLGKLQAAVENYRHSNEPMAEFLRELSVNMTAEPARAPDVVRAILQANLSSSSVRQVMQQNHQRAHALLTRLMQTGQDRGEFRRDLPASELAQVFRQTVFGTLLIWSAYGDASLPDRINTALAVLWTGLAPREQQKLTAAEGPADGESGPMNRKTVLIIVVVAAAVAVAAYGAGWFRHDSGLQGSGTVEARDTRVGSKIGGRISEVLAREGDRVKAGQVLITFDDKELLASLEQSRAAALKAERGYRPEEIEEARAAAAQAKAEYEQRVNGYRKEDVQAAKADLDRAKADENRTRLDYERYDALAKKDLVSKQQRDTAEAAWRIAVAMVQNTQQKLDALQRGYRPEEIAAAKARYEQAQATQEKLERGNRREDVELAKAALAYDEARFRERQVAAPADSIVEVLDVRPGDLIAPNTPIATLLEAGQIYVRIYIPETEIGLVKVGQKAEIRVDSFASKVFDGEVEQINQQAEFLPRNVQTRQERVHQVFGVKVRINDPSGQVLAGMAADVKLKSGQ